MEYFLLTSRNVGVRSNPPRKSRMGIVSPLDGEPSMIYMRISKVLEPFSLSLQNSPQIEPKSHSHYTDLVPHPSSPCE